MTRPLRIAVLTEFVRALPTDTSRWVPVLTSGLRSRGHRVTVLADGVEQPDVLGDVPTVVHRHGRIHHGCEPFGFRRWARRTQSELAPDVTLSLTDHIAADVWLPLGPGPWTFLDSLRHTTPVGAVLDLAHRPWVLLELLSQRAALRDATRLGALRATFAADPSSTRGLGDALSLPTASPLACVSEEHRTAMRERARAAMRVAPATPLLLLSANDHELEHLDVVFEAFSLMRAHSSASPRVLLASRTPTKVRRRAARHGVADVIQSIGTTHNSAALLCAADAAIVPCPARAGESTGRFIADALAIGMPIIANAAAAGARLISSEAGIRLHAAGASRWRDAILHACDEAWRGRSSVAARACSAPLEGVLDALESALIARAAARGFTAPVLAPASATA